MNKYIDDLACSVLDDMSADGDWYVPDEFIEKFAILIANECLSFIEEGGADFAKFMINVNFKTSGTTDELKALYNEHRDKTVWLGPEDIRKTEDYINLETKSKGK